MYRLFLRLALLVLLVTVLSLSACSNESGLNNGGQYERITICSGISWDEAKEHIGERTTVCGPIVDTNYASSSNGRPTFLNMGRSYPDPARFTVVIWGQNRSNFPSSPEVYYRGKTIHVTGLITEYRGSAQIEASNQSQINVK